MLVLVASRPGFFGNLTIFRRPAIGRETTRDIHPSVRVSFIAASRDVDARRLDTVAGCEFLDDRIRLRG